MPGGNEEVSGHLHVCQLTYILCTGWFLTVHVQLQLQLCHTSHSTLSLYIAIKSRSASLTVVLPCLRLLDILEVIAPYKHFHKLRQFVDLKLPAGFPVKLGELTQRITCEPVFSPFKLKVLVRMHILGGVSVHIKAIGSTPVHIKALKGQGVLASYLLPMITTLRI